MPVPRLHLWVLLLLAPAHAGVAGAAEPIGAETCKACHPGAYEVWRESGHSRAYQSLPEKSRGDARCTACHAPEGAKAQAGVSCESCHGNGQLYARRWVMRDRELARALGLLDVGEKSCLRCHDESTPSVTRFDHARKLPLIQHGEADRETRRAGPAGR